MNAAEERAMVEAGAKAAAPETVERVSAKERFILFFLLKVPVFVFCLQIIENNCEDTEYFEFPNYTLTLDLIIAHTT